MDEKKKAQIDVSQLPDGLKELIAPVEKVAALPAGKKEAIALPAASTSAAQMRRQGTDSPATPNTPAKQQPERPKTEKEIELDALIAKRQGIIDQLKSKNPLVLESRKKISAIIPSIRGKGAPQAIRLIEEAERLEFSIATEAYTPAKEKELIKRLREIKHELSKHKELEAAQKAVDAERSALHSLISEIKALEKELFETRAACEAKYQEVLGERKANYENRTNNREERFHQHEEQKHRQYEELKQRVRQERKKEYDEDMGKYMKDYDDTVSMEEIVQIEKKEKKQKKEDD
ncbi:Uncharacterised protein [uncultured archaeon]|nr:Uncharacterised protein [uncultured archaeon]